MKLSHESEPSLMKRTENEMFVMLVARCVLNGYPQKGWHGFTVFGKAVLFGDVIEP
jgi:hypothetical protein